ncbi:ABC transporter permease [Pigmentiphaga soli]|uniref:ABC transporter permease n=1 Tax=Pigmentiphaga soli TaxID=1007095 RepID=A0ABP8GGI6_9BURK
MNHPAVSPLVLPAPARGPLLARRLARLRPVLLPLAAGVLLWLAWTAAVGRFGVSPVILPAPGAIAGAFHTSFPLLMEHLRQTAGEALVGLALSTACGLLIAVAISLSEAIYRAVYPVLIAIQVIPKVALAPLFVIWIGVGIETRMAFAAFLAFFPIVVSAATGFVRADENLLRLCRAYSASRWQVFVSVRLPGAVPHIFSGLKVGATMTMIGLIVGEFVTAQSGLGYLTMFGAATLETAFMMAAISLICAIGATLYLVMTLCEKLVRRLMGI